MKAVEQWTGEDSENGELPFPVCKAGYRPFGPSGERLYGCTRHSDVRKERIEKAEGYLRPGWAAFDQWDSQRPRATMQQPATLFAQRPRTAPKLKNLSS
mmetsp:Transcript_9239/g.30513  ORF Transcript_9239/g.30513 Transcript_9239/m.30513 type:complete len:99 (-) Transcript_9239:2670-2966(-)